MSDAPHAQAADDPRPLVGEPLPLELVNTRWLDQGEQRDLLDSPAGLRIWLKAVDLADAAQPGRADRAGHVEQAEQDQEQAEQDQEQAEQDQEQDTLNALRSTRDALCRLLNAGTESRSNTSAAEAALNSTLDHGRVRWFLTPDGPRSEVEVDQPCWRPAWAAAEGYLRLVEQAPDRIRRCGSPDCVLYFYDVSKSGRRRWCSMAACGNRAKASRHYVRNRRAREGS